MITIEEQNDVTLDDLDIQVLKLSSGDEIMGILVSDDTLDLLLSRGEITVEDYDEAEERSNYFVSVESPVKVNTVIRDSSTYSFFTQYNPFARNSILDIDLNHIITNYRVNDDAKLHYIRIVNDMRESATFDELDSSDSNDDSNDSNNDKIIVNKSVMH